MQTGWPTTLYDLRISGLGWWECSWCICYKLAILHHSCPKPSITLQCDILLQIVMSGEQMCLRQPFSTFLNAFCCARPHDHLVSFYISGFVMSDRRGKNLLRYWARPNRWWMAATSSGYGISISVYLNFVVVHAQVIGSCTNTTCIRYWNTSQYSWFQTAFSSTGTDRRECWM